MTILVASSRPREQEELNILLGDLVSRFNERDLPRALLRDVGLVLIQRLAPRDEVTLRALQWNDRWRETVRLEAQPLRRHG
ncbi:hypothetical protein VQH23_00125 [Pararoseomonas sp. SCSIO 73927]|uniref:hypothetical protein n=1 Tax=Pararoseomonas sp. SCSIO 73927 TaxID=3114537 RepID=UPI0030D4AF38